MRCFAVLLLCCAAISLGAQTPSESTRVDSVAPPPPPPSPPAPPSPEQKRFLDGLKIATRGIAQFKDGLGRVTRASKRDSVAQRRAGRFLAGLCGSGRAFLRRGRPQMNPTVYEDTVGVKAKRLVTQIDSLIAFTPSCEQRAAAVPDSTAVALGKRMKSYDTAWRDFRLAIGLPVKEDSAKTPRR
jgi:hypothetical protein